MEYKMLFDLPPILGLAPIFLYMFLGFRGVHPLIATVSSCFLGAVLSQQTLMSFAVSIKNGAGSFLALIGLLVVLGTSLAEVLKESGGGQILVRGILKHFGHSQRGIILGTMIALVIFSVSLGSMVASTALVATVAIAMAATAKISPSAMAIAFHCGSVAGLFIGPFSAPTVQMLEISKLTYWEYLLGVSLPMAIIVFCVGVFMSFRAQRLYGSTMLYPEEDAEKLDDEFTPTNPQKRSAWAFCLTITSLIAYGIYIKGGMTFAFAIMILVAIITGLSGGMGTKGKLWIPCFVAEKECCGSI